MAGSELVYNGITLRDVLTLEFSQSPKRDPSGTDRWFNYYVLRVEGVAGPSLLGLSSGPGITGQNGDNTAELVRLLNQKLGQDRGNLTYKIDGNTLLDVRGAKEYETQPASQIDLDNGPKVQHVRVSKITRNNVRVEFGVVVAVPSCDGTIPDVLCHRWSVMDDVDELQRTHRTWRGYLRVPKLNADATSFRGLVVPPLLSSFKRQRMQFTSDPNGLEMSYTISDVEMLGEAPPSPASRMSGTMAMAVSGDATQSHANLNLRLDGPRNADKQQLLQRALQIAFVKLRLTNPENVPILQNMTVVDYFSDDVNSVGLEATATFNPSWRLDNGSGINRSVGDLAVGALFQDLNGNIPAYDGTASHTYQGPYGTAGADSLSNVFVCFLQNPCKGRITTKTESSDNSNIGQGDDSVENDGEPDITDNTGNASAAYQPPKYSSEMEDSQYTHYTLQVTVDRQSMKIACPIARQDGGKGPTVKFIRLSPDISFLMVRLAGERIGRRGGKSWPQIFKVAEFTDDYDIEYVPCENSKICMHAPILNSDGTNYTYAVDAEYRWAMSRPLDDGEVPLVGSLPWDDTSTEVFVPNPAVMVDPYGPQGII